MVSQRALQRWARERLRSTSRALHARDDRRNATYAHLSCGFATLFCEGSPSKTNSGRYTFSLMPEPSATTPLQPRLVSALGLMLFMLSCVGSSSTGGVPCSKTGREVLASSCDACHSALVTGAQRAGAPEGVNFDTDGDVRRQAAKIRDRAIVQLTMPLGAPLADCNQKTLDGFLTQLEQSGCLPSCSGRTCGDDGCGGSCGSCSQALTCTPDGQCIQATCTPDCVGAACGDDGCSGSCGTCAKTLVCSSTRTCACQPSCVGKVCGSDGCGGSCGACGVTDTCSVTGQCLCIPKCSGKQCGSDGCGGVCGTCPSGQACDASAQCACVKTCSTKQCGPDGCGGSCGSCGGVLVCNTKVGSCTGKCTPSCTGRVCGDDGCGGSCGPCQSGQACDSSGQCICSPSCIGKTCGADGCGGSCGTCGAGLLCGATGQCGCTGSCSGRVCGSDGCGGECGACPSGQGCNASGQCGCAPQCSGVQCGSDGCGGSCGSCTSGSTCSSGQCTWPKKLFASDVEPILQKNGCGSSGSGGASCHSGSRPAENLDLSTAALGYSGLVNAFSTECKSKYRVKPNDLAGSYLINKLTGSGMCSGSQMPKVGSSIPSTDLDVIRAWVSTGAAP